jgi:Phage integrase family.
VYLASAFLSFLSDLSKRGINNLRGFSDGRCSESHPLRHIYKTRVKSRLLTPCYGHAAIFLHTGRREREMMYATWDDVDFKQRKFHVTGDGKEDVNFVPKNHEERWIPLTTELLELLK